MSQFQKKKNEGLKSGLDFLPLVGCQVWCWWAQVVVWWHKDWRRRGLASQLIFLPVFSCIFHFIYGVSSLPLTNSIIFQDVSNAPPSSQSFGLPDADLTEADKIAKFHRIVSSTLGRVHQWFETKKTARIQLLDTFGPLLSSALLQASVGISAVNIAGGFLVSKSHEDGWLRDYRLYILALGRGLY